VTCSHCRDEGAVAHGHDAASESGRSKLFITDKGQDRFWPCPLDNICFRLRLSVLFYLTFTVSLPSKATCSPSCSAMRLTVNVTAFPVGTLIRSSASNFAM